MKRHSKHSNKKNQQLKVVILAGGFGTRISEETGVRPKPMVEIGGRPILWHIMKIYSSYGFNDFIICAGYKGNMIKEYFSNFFMDGHDVTFDLTKKTSQYHTNESAPWKVTVVDTGAETLTGGRIKRIQKYIGNSAFCLTYGDGVADVNVRDLVKFHKDQGRLATVTAVRPPQNFGVLSIQKEGSAVKNFSEKPNDNGNWINGGFFVLEPKIFDYIDGDKTTWEMEPLNTLAKEGQLVAYRHEGYWRPMDTLQDKQKLEEKWKSGNAPWKKW